MTLPTPAEIQASLLPACVFLGVLVGLLVARHVVLRHARRWAVRTDNTVDDLLIHALAVPSALWALAIALHVSLPLAPLPDELVTPARTGLLVVLILSVTLATANLAGGMMGVLVSRLEGSDRKGRARVSGLGQGLVRAVVGFIGLTVLLKAVGVEIAPLLTALGVGGLAVALALQDTLGNFFAGVHVLLEKPFSIGDFIRLESGQEGTVADVSWRTTRIRTLDDHVVVLPNSKIAGSTIVNFHLPDPRNRLTLEIGVEYGSDLDAVRALLIDEVRAVTAEGGLFANEPAGDAGVTRFGEWAVYLSVRFYVHDVRMAFPATDAMARRLYARLRAEGVRIPLPTQQVLLRRADGA